MPSQSDWRAFSRPELPSSKRLANAVLSAASIRAMLWAGTERGAADASVGDEDGAPVAQWCASDDTQGRLCPPRMAFRRGTSASSKGPSRGPPSRTGPWRCAAPISHGCSRSTNTSQMLRTGSLAAAGESRDGVSPPRALRTVCERLSSYGSPAFHRSHREAAKWGKSPGACVTTRASPDDAAISTSPPDSTHHRTRTPTATTTTSFEGNAINSKTWTVSSVR